MKNVLITGGTGSFGQAMAKYLLRDTDDPVYQEVERVVIYSRGEHLQEQMKSEFDNKKLRFFIGDVRDEQRLTMAMHGVDTVFHAAALKIVPTAEYNPFEAVKTNIHGAENVVRASIAAGVSKVIALSTDKAVNPINLYGATKLAAEKIFVAANSLSAGKCSFSVVRYGNVVGSRGSVLPLFKRLVKEGLPLPITDERMTRFWLTMAQALAFTLASAEMAVGKEIFIPQIPSIRIVDLAEALAPGAERDFIGIRDGEKLHETLLSEDECRLAGYTSHGLVLWPKGQYIRTPYTSGKYSSDKNPQFLSIEELKRWR